MGDLIPSAGSGLVALLHKDGPLAVPKPFARDIFLFDTHVAGTSHVEGMEDLEPHLHIDDKLDFLREPDNPYDARAIAVRNGQAAFCPDRLQGEGREVAEDCDQGVFARVSAEGFTLSSSRATTQNGIFQPRSCLIQMFPS